MDQAEVCGFVLAGGRSTRMGQDKALLKLNGETLAARAVRQLHRFCAEVAFAGGAPELRHLARIIPDAHPGCGPLGGIVAALEQSLYEWNFFIAVDMPFIPDSVLKTLAFTGDRHALAIVARAEGFIQPLCAIYSRQALPHLRGELEGGRFKLKDAIAPIARYIEFESEAWFRNLNTPEDYTSAIRR